MASCTGNLRQIGLGFTMYTTNWDGYYPMRGPVSRKWTYPFAWELYTPNAPTPGNTWAGWTSTGSALRKEIETYGSPTGYDCPLTASSAKDFWPEQPENNRYAWKWPGYAIFAGTMSVQKHDMGSAIREKDGLYSVGGQYYGSKRATDYSIDNMGVSLEYAYEAATPYRANRVNPGEALAGDRRQY